MFIISPPPLIKIVSNTRLCSKLGGTTLNGGEEIGERFEVRKVCFTWYCLNIFSTGCSYHFFELENDYVDYGDGNHDNVNTRRGSRKSRKGRLGLLPAIYGPSQ